MSAESSDPGGVDFGDEAVTLEHLRWRAAALRQLPLFVQVYSGPEHVDVGESDMVTSLYGESNVGRKVTDYLTGAEGQGLIEMYDRVYGGERIIARGVRIGIVTEAGVEREVFTDVDFLPMRDASGEIVGTIATAKDVTDQLRTEAEQASAAAELSRRYRRATDVIEEVQRALLPSRLPVLPGVELAAGYVVGGAEQAAGGDWFDVLPRPDGSVAAVVGDVVGHGVAASAVMSQLRAVALERLHAGAGPAEVVAALDRFVEVVPGGRSATVCVLVLRPEGGSVEYCTAGHPPPLVVDVAGDSHYLAPVPAPPIGSRDERLPSTGTLAPGELVLLYTDGIIERPGVSATTGTVDLARAAADAAADRLMPVFTLPSVVDRVTTQTLERLTRLTGSADDITLLALQPVTPLPALQIATDLDRSGIVGVRAQLRRWLGPERVAEEVIDQLDQVLTELCDNVIEHAYGSAGAGPVTVDAWLDQLGVVTLTVSDQGGWRPPAGLASGRGLGLAIVQDLAEDVRLVPGSQGTTVTVRFRPWKSSAGSAPQAPRDVPEFFDVYTESRPDRSILRARGPVDVPNVPELDAELAIRVTPGSPPLTVDLGQVSVFSSAAVHAVRRRLDQGRAAGVDVELVSSPGTVAHHVLALVGITTGHHTAVS